MIAKVEPLQQPVRKAVGRPGTERQRLACVEELAAFVEFLLGPDASFFCGSVLFCDGGTDALLRVPQLLSIRPRCTGQGGQRRGASVRGYRISPAMPRVHQGNSAAATARCPDSQPAPPRHGKVHLCSRMEGCRRRPGSMWARSFRTRARRAVQLVGWWMDSTDQLVQPERSPPREFNGCSGRVLLTCKPL